MNGPNLCGCPRPLVEDIRECTRCGREVHEQTFTLSPKAQRMALLIADLVLERLEERESRQKPGEERCVILTPEQLAQRWGVSTKYVYSRAKLGEIPTIPLPGRVVRFRLDQIEQFERGDLTCPEKAV